MTTVNNLTMWFSVDIHTSRWLVCWFVFAQMRSYIHAFYNMHASFTDLQLSMSVSPHLP